MNRLPPPGEAASEELVGVAFAGDRAEAEMIQGLLEGDGIPSALQPVGVDAVGLAFGGINPSGGSRRVMVRAEDAEKARTLLECALAEGERLDLTEAAEAPFPEAFGREPRGYTHLGAFARIFAWSLGTLALAFAVFALLYTT